MKKIPLLFLISLIIFTAFIIYSLAQSSPSTRQNAATATPTNSNLCIITISGQKYDVTQFQYQHQGGNIFQCGTDMSVIFTNQHQKNYLNKMKRYLIP